MGSQVSHATIEEPHRQTVHHLLRDSVAFDRTVDQFTSILLGAKESTRERQSRGVAQLRVDMRRGRNQAVRSILRVVLADLAEHEDPKRVAEFSEALTGFVYATANETAADLPGAIEEEFEVDGRENPLEIAFLRGDRSHPTMRRLGTAFREHIRRLQAGERAVHVLLHGVRQ